jgi:hypothetical protein
VQLTQRRGARAQPLEDGGEILQRHPGLLGDRPTDRRPVQDRALAGEECQPSFADDRIGERRAGGRRGQAAGDHRLRPVLPGGAPVTRRC